MVKIEHGRATLSAGTFETRNATGESEIEIVASKSFEIRVNNAALGVDETEVTLYMSAKELRLFANVLTTMADLHGD